MHRLIRPMLLLALGLLFAACAPPPPPTATPTNTPLPLTATPTALLPTATPQTAQPAEVTLEASASDAAPVARVDQDNTVLRAGPGTSFERAGTARSGETFPVTGRSGEGRTLWYQITLTDGSTAWLWSRVSTLQPADADIPEVDPPAS